jgi:hypothetical protein
VALHRLRGTLPSRRPACLALAGLLTAMPTRLRLKSAPLMPQKVILSRLRTWCESHQTLSLCTGRLHSQLAVVLAVRRVLNPGPRFWLQHGAVLLLASVALGLSIMKLALISPGQRRRAPLTQSSSVLSSSVLLATAVVMVARLLLSLQTPPLPTPAPSPPPALTRTPTWTPTPPAPLPV